MKRTINMAVSLSQWLIAIERALSHSTHLPPPPRRTFLPDVTEYLKKAITADKAAVVKYLLDYPHDKQSLVNHIVSDSGSVSAAALVIADVHWDFLPIQIQSQVLLQAAVNRDQRCYSRMSQKERLAIVDADNLGALLRASWTTTTQVTVPATTQLTFSTTPQQLTVSTSDLLLPSCEWNELITRVGGPFTALKILSEQPEYKSEFAALLFAMPCDDDEISLREESFWQHLTEAAERGDERLILWLLRLQSTEDLSVERVCSVISAACRYEEDHSGEEDHSDEKEPSPHALVSHLLSTLRAFNLLNTSHFAVLLGEALHSKCDAPIRSLINFYVYSPEFCTSALRCLQKESMIASRAPLKYLWLCLADITEDASLRDLMVSSLSISCIVEKDQLRYRDNKELLIAASMGNFVFICENIGHIMDNASLSQCYLLALQKGSAYHANLLASKISARQGEGNDSQDNKEIRLEDIDESSVVQALLTLSSYSLELLLAFHAPLTITERGVAMLFAMALQRDDAGPYTKALLRFDTSCIASRPLREACAAGCTDVVKVLLSDKRSNLSVRNNLPIRLAADNNHVDIVALLLAAGADPGDCADYAVRWACIEGRADMAALLLADRRVDPSCVDGYGRVRSCKQHIILSSGAATIRKLLKDVSRPFPEEARQLILYTAEKGFSSVTTLLLRDGRCYSRLSFADITLLLRAIYDKCDLECLIELLQLQIPDFVLLQCARGRQDSIRRQLVLQHCAEAYTGEAVGPQSDDNYIVKARNDTGRDKVDNASITEKDPEKKDQKEDKAINSVIPMLNEIVDLNELTEENTVEDGIIEVKENDSSFHQSSSAPTQPPNAPSAPAEINDTESGDSECDNKFATKEAVQEVVKEDKNQSPQTNRKKGKTKTANVKDRARKYNNDNMYEFVTLCTNLEQKERNEYLSVMTVAQLRILCRIQGLKPGLSKKEDLINLFLRSLK